MILKKLIILGLVGSVVCSGCQIIFPEPTQEQLSRGLLWMFPGIEGKPWLLAEPQRAFRDAGYDGAIYAYEWKHLFPLANLMDERSNQEGALKVAQQIIQYHRSYPDRPICLVGYSGGGGMVVLVAERLPAEVKLQNVVLVQAAVSPDYNLTEALEHIEGGLVNFYSEKDWIVLGLGTSVFGTIDRENTESAGKVGFKLAEAVPEVSLQSKLQQHCRTKEMLSAGHFGGHSTFLFYEWNKKYVSPYLVGNQEEK